MGRGGAHTASLSHSEMVLMTTDILTPHSAAYGAAGRCFKCGSTPAISTAVFGSQATLKEKNGSGVGRTEPRLKGAGPKGRIMFCVQQSENRQ